MLIDWAIDIIDALFNRGKLVRRTIVLWSLCLISWAVYVIVPKLTGGESVTALGLIIGIFSPITVFYIYLRNKDND